MDDGNYRCWTGCTGGWNVERASAMAEAAHLANEGSAGADTAIGGRSLIRRESGGILNLSTAVSAPVRGLKAITRMIWPNSRRALGLMLPRTWHDYERDVNAIRNSAVVACVNWLARSFPEAPLVVTRSDSSGGRSIEPDHELARLLARPNPFYSGPVMLMAIIVDYVTAGNAYWVKIRSQSGRVVELWWVPQSLIEPRWPAGGSAFISHYDYRTGARPVRLETDDVVHFRFGLDPENPRKGLSPLASVLREIFTDDEAGNFSASLLKNLGVPGVILNPREPFGGSDEELELVKEKFRETFGGDNRGDVMLMRGPTDVHVLSFSPEQMNLRDLRRIPEERVSAVLGVPAIVAGLGAGLDRSTFANMAEAREMAYESGIIPLQRLVAAELNEQLLPEFEEAPGAAVGFDLRDVRVLREDQRALAERLGVLVQRGVMKRSEARAELGLSVDPTDEVYLLPKGLVEAGAGGDRAKTAAPLPGSQVIDSHVEAHQIPAGLNGQT